MHFRKKDCEFFYYIIKGDFQKKIGRGIFRKKFLLSVGGILELNTKQKVSSKYLH